MYRWACLCAILADGFQFDATGSGFEKDYSIWSHAKVGKPYQNTIENRQRNEYWPKLLKFDKFICCQHNWNSIGVEFNATKKTNKKRKNEKNERKKIRGPRDHIVAQLVSDCEWKLYLDCMYRYFMTWYEHFFFRITLVDILG